jgi:hypothetical protein
LREKVFLLVKRNRISIVINNLDINLKQKPQVCRKIRRIMAYKITIKQLIYVKSHIGKQINRCYHKNNYIFA